MRYRYKILSLAITVTINLYKQLMHHGERSRHLQRERPAARPCTHVFTTRFQLQDAAALLGPPWTMAACLGVLLATIVLSVSADIRSPPMMNLFFLGCLIFSFLFKTRELTLRQKTTTSTLQKKKTSMIYLEGLRKHLIDNASLANSNTEPKFLFVLKPAFTLNIARFTQQLEIHFRIASNSIRALHLKKLNTPQISGANITRR